MCTTNDKRFLVMVFSMALLWGGCTAPDVAIEIPSEPIIALRFELEGGAMNTRLPSDAALAIDRILILPFKKIDESLPNDATNFQPVYSAAKQLNVQSFPAVSTLLELSATATYQLMVLGYNRADYDFYNQGMTSRRFDLGSANAPTTLSNLYVKPVSAVNTPELFACMATGYNQSTAVGSCFKTTQINHIEGTLKRLVSGLTLEVSNIPDYIKSVKLIAEQLVTASRLPDATPLQWQVANDGGAKELGSLQPVSGKVNFELFVLPTSDTRKTMLYLDVAYGIFTQRYTVKLADKAGVSSSNRLIFVPNQWVKITGDYAKINLGFKLTGNINLDDNQWDGLQ